MDRWMDCVALSKLKHDIIGSTEQCARSDFFLSLHILPPKAIQPWSRLRRLPHHFFFILAFLQNREQESFNAYIFSRFVMFLSWIGNGEKMCQVKKQITSWWWYHYFFCLLPVLFVPTYDYKKNLFLLFGTNKEVGKMNACIEQMLLLWLEKGPAIAK